MAEDFYTHAQTVAALCVMEHFIDCESDAKITTDEQCKALASYRANHGVYELRDRAIEMGVLIEEAFDQAMQALGVDWNEGHAYDWELVPKACRLICWSASACAMPSVEQLVELFKQLAETWKREDWMRHARSYAKEWFADDGSVVEQEWLDRCYTSLPPEEKAFLDSARYAVDEYAEKYGLAKASKGW